MNQLKPRIRQTQWPNWPHLEVGPIGVDFDKRIFLIFDTTTLCTHQMAGFDL